MHRWWGRQQWQLDETLAWNLAELHLSVTRFAQEWQLRIVQSTRISEEQKHWQFHGHSAPLDLPGMELRRHISGDTHDSLQLLPALADRPVVVRPAYPIYIGAQVSVLLHISTPVWVMLRQDESGPSLLDIPITRPTDSWLGANTREGEICYATRVFGRLHLHEISLHPFRAVTPVRILNDSDAAFPLERLAVPVQLLPLHISEAGRLWTPTLNLRCHASSQHAEIHVARDVDAMAGPTTLLTPPRTPLGGGNLIRALDSLIASRKIAS